MTDEKMLRVVNVADELKFRSICAIFEENEIPYLVQSQDEYLRMISGFDFFEKEIYVAEHDFNKANELLIYFMDDLDDPSNVYLDE
ncbi:MAG: DUF2007 domain-containing protein [Tissierellia bacterium]|nr:DUF2007 domain-containing protein [Tissierellia bacterium]